MSVFLGWQIICCLCGVNLTGRDYVDQFDYRFGACTDIWKDNGKGD